MKKCGAKTRAGGKCQYRAGQGTDHLGTGKCRLHGGASKGAPKGNKNAHKHGIYSRLFSEQDLDAAREMQGSIETELAIARIQLFKLIELQNKSQEKPQLDRIEEKSIVSEDGEKGKKLISLLIRSAKEAGEDYDPDDDKEYFDDEERKRNESESDPFERRRIYQRRDISGEFVRLTALIARLEQQLISMHKTKAEITVIEASGKKDDTDENTLTDEELAREIHELVEGLT